MRNLENDGDSFSQSMIHNYHKYLKGDLATWCFLFLSILFSVIDTYQRFSEKNREDPILSRFREKCD